MGKLRQPARKHTNHHDNPQSTKAAVQRRHHSQTQPRRADSKVKTKGKNRAQSLRLKVPFRRHDNVLLVGEGDFSFSQSLLQSHPVAAITATCYDTQETLEMKYPDVNKTIALLQRTPDTEWRGFSPMSETSEISESDFTALCTPQCSVLYEIDATKLSTTHKKALRPFSPFTKIVFNFPHVGGLSTDVNRQVRSNQQLLVGFFSSAKHLLTTSENPSRFAKAPYDDLKESDFGNDNEETYSTTDPVSVKGQILVTLFETEPYTLWNLRDLARHCGLQVIESFKFPWSAYPGYQHARTAGDITIGKDRSSEGKRKGAWRGEEREARCFIIEVKDEDGKGNRNTLRKGKKPAADEQDNSD